MCGGAIISGFIQPPASSSRVTADFLWPATDANKKNPSGNYYSKPLRSQIFDLGEDFEADFQDFKDYSDDEEDDDVNVKPFAFSAAKSGLTRDLQNLWKVADWLKNLRRESEKISTAELGSDHGVNGLPRSVIRGKGFRVWLGTFNAAEEAARACDAEARKIRGKIHVKI